MIAPTQQQLYDGAQSPPEAMVELRAGALTMLYDNGTIRQLKLGNVPVLHQIYAAVRDQNWGTVPAQMDDFQMDLQPDHFEIRFKMHHQQGDIDFEWDGQIIGSAENTVTFSFDGVANSTFKRNRIGFCVLHPMTLAGQACLVEHVDGSTVNGEFPEMIAPHQPYFDLRALTHDVVDGVQARVLMEGDTFEMEDQRNWIDASYKTYCTPLGLPFPAVVEKGERISQKITLEVSGDVPRTTHGEQTLCLTIGDEAKLLPAIGLGLNDAIPTDDEISLLRALNLAHVRGEVRFQNEDARSQLDSVIQRATRLDTKLELALFLTQNAEAELQQTASWVTTSDVLARIIVFVEGEKSTPPEIARRARQALNQLNIPIGAGTDAFFTELNRARPPAEDFIVYSINPQVHAFDNLSLVETLAAHVPTINTARDFSGNAPVVVGPVTFKMRWNPNATGAIAPVPAGELPPQVDPRQMSLFGAGWTLGSIKYLAENGVEAATYYETIGWRGLLDLQNESSVPEKFAYVRGTVFPMYHVFRAIGDYDAVVVSQSTDTLKVEGLTLRKGDQVRVLLANLTAQPQTVTVENLTGNCTVRILDEPTARATLTDPEAFWKHSAPLESTTLELPPYALAIIDQEAD